MRTLLSTRRATFYRLVRQAHAVSSKRLGEGVKGKTRNNGHFRALARLACLRILVCRDYGINSPSGLPYPQRKKAVRAALGI